MITYLQGGWYTRLGKRRLRNEVVDGAIDTASMLFRAAVPPEAISSLALKIRTLASIADPPHRANHGSDFLAAEHGALSRRLQIYTDRFPALQGFVNDCLEHVANANELRALYLHLVHITQMTQLLLVAKLSGVSDMASFPRPAPEAVAAPARRRKTVAKKAAKKITKKQQRKPARKHCRSKKSARRSVERKRQKRTSPRKNSLCIRAK